jgi:hypothetical protein
MPEEWSTLQADPPAGGPDSSARSRPTGGGSRALRSAFSGHRQRVLRVAPPRRVLPSESFGQLDLVELEMAPCRWLRADGRPCSRWRHCLPSATPECRCNQALGCLAPRTTTCHPCPNETWLKKPIRPRCRDERNGLPGLTLYNLYIKTNLLNNTLIPESHLIQVGKLIDEAVNRIEISAMNDKTCVEQPTPHACSEKPF